MGTSTVFRLNTIDAEFADAVRCAWRSLSVGPTNICTYAVKKSTKPNHSLTCRDDLLCNRLVSDTLHKRIIPDYVFAWDRILKLAFVGGLMDSEGFVAANSNPTNRRFYMGYKSCDAWVRDFIRILQSVGIVVGKVAQETPAKPCYKMPTRFAIKMQSWVESGARFCIVRKQSRVDLWASAGAYEHRARFPRRSSSQRLPAEAH